MRISKKGLYALVAMRRLAANYGRGKRLTPTPELASREGIPGNFLELILLQLKTARLVESERGVHGGYRLSRAPSRIVLGQIIRIIDGPLAPFGNAASLRRLVANDKRHSAIYRVFLDVRNSAARILDHTSLADLCRRR